MTMKIASKPQVTSKNTPKNAEKKAYKKEIADKVKKADTENYLGKKKPDGKIGSGKEFDALSKDLKLSKQAKEKLRKAVYTTEDTGAEALASTKEVSKSLRQMDADKNGTISAKEVQVFNPEDPKKPLTEIKTDTETQKTENTQTEQPRSKRSSGSRSSGASETGSAGSTGRIDGAGNTAGTGATSATGDASGVDAQMEKLDLSTALTYLQQLVKAPDGATNPQLISQLEMIFNNPNLTDEEIVQFLAQLKMVMDPALLAQLQQKIAQVLQQNPQSPLKRLQEALQKEQTGTQQQPNMLQAANNGYPGASGMNMIA